MAANGKKFDPQKFLDEYEDNISESIKRTNAAARKKEVQELPPEETNSEPPSQIQEKPEPEKKEAKRRKKYRRLESDDAEISAYIENFLVERIEPGFAKNGCQVFIDPEFHNKIMLIKTLLCRNLTFGGYIHNVLKKHFEDLDETINKMFIENPIIKSH